MATAFLETPDATQGKEFWTTVVGTVVYDSATATKSGLASWKSGNAGVSQDNYLDAAKTGKRGQAWFRIADLPSATTRILQGDDIAIQLTTAGVLQLWNTDTPAQIGSNGSTLSTATWYLLTLVSDAASSNFKVFLNSVQDISAAASPPTFGLNWDFGYKTAGANKFLNFQHVYIDDVNDLTAPGDIRITAKRPNANGTLIEFTTQIGAGGSGYGSGHSPQVNERPLSTTNGWSIAATAVKTEEYNIEGQTVGDINLSGATLVDYTGWVHAKALIAETGKIRVNNVDTNISLTSTITMFTKIAASTTYPAATGTDIGILTSATETTVSLYEAGIMFAYNPLDLWAQAML